MTVPERIIKAKIWIARKDNFPFWGYLLFQLKPTAIKDIPLTATDGEHLYYNEIELSKCSDSELRGLLIHEVQHVALGHLWRVGARDKLIWNLAGDYIINQDIKKHENQSLSLPKGVCYDQKYEGWFTEAVYKDLLKTVKKYEISIGPKGKGKFKVCGSSAKWSKKDKGELKKMERKWNREIKRAAEIHKKDRGDLPGELQRLVEDSEPKVDWKKVLISYITQSFDDYTYSRPDRRLLSSDFIFPAMEFGEKLEDIVIAIDTSGSISPKLLTDFVGEVKGITKSFSNVKAYCCSWDTQVYNWEEIDRYTPKVKPMGGGGTSTICVFNEIKKRKIQPNCVLFFTDLYAEFPSKKPSFDVIWLAPKSDHGTPPNFGRLIKYEHEDI